MSKIVFSFSFLLLSFTLIAQNKPVASPKNAVIHTIDVENFWQLLDLLPSAKHTQDSLQLLRTHYLDKASPCLQEIVTMEKQQNRRDVEKEYLTLLHQYPRYFASLKTNRKVIEQQKEHIVKAYSALKAIYPDAHFPPVYFAFGIFNTGSIVKECGLYIGAEMHLLTKQTDLSEFAPGTWWLSDSTVTLDYLTSVVLHEQIHAMQRLKFPGTLLDQAFIEGSADFITRLITGRTGGIDTKAHQYGHRHEATIWKEFQQDMYSKDIYTTKWFANPTNSDLPENIIYFIGYAICESFYRKATDKKQFVRQVLETTDGISFLKASSYLEKFK